MPLTNQFLSAMRRSFYVLLILGVALGTVAHAQTFQSISAMSFTMPFAGANPLPQIVTVSQVSGTLRFTPSATTNSGGNWLVVTPSNAGCCYAPYPVAVSISGAGLAAGTYTGQVVFTDYNNSNNKITVPVTLTVASTGTTFFDNLAGKLSFSMKTGATAVTSQPIQIRNGGSGTLNWTVSASTGIGGNWLTTSAASGTAPSTVNVGIDPTKLPAGAGTYIGMLVFSTSGQSTSIPVAVTVGSSVFEQINPISFTMPFGGKNPLNQILVIEASDNSAVRFTPSAATGNGGNWLSVSPNNAGCCYAPFPVTISVTPGTLAAGSYTGEITFTEYANPARSMTVPVTLNVMPSGAFFTDLAGGLSYTLKTNGTASSQQVQIANGGTGSLNWTAVPTTSDASPWLSVSAASGTAPSVVTVAVDAAKLPGGGAVAGTYVGQVLFQATGNTTSIPVAVTVGSSNLEQVNPIFVTMPFGGKNPLPQILNIASSDNSAIRFTPTASTGQGGSWLSVSPNNAGCCYSPFPITVSVNASTLAAGTYTGEITINEYANPARSINVPVTLNIVASGAFFDNLPGGLSFSLLKGGAGVAQRIQVNNAGSGTLNWTLLAVTSDAGNWLKPATTSGTAPSAVSIDLDPSALPGNGLIAGTYVGNLLFQGNGDLSSIPVTVTVGDSVFEQINPVAFTMPFGGANPPAQTLLVESTDNSAIRFTPTAATANGGNWLTVSPNNAGCCYTPYGVTVSINASTLPAGTYTGEITFAEYANPARSMTVPVTLTVAASGAFFNNLPGGMSFSMAKGAKAVAAQSLQIGNGGSGKLSWTLTPTTADGGDWLLPSAVKGTAPKTLTIKIAPALLPNKGQIAGTYTGQLLFATSSGDTASVPVTVTVGDGVFTQLNPLNFVMPVGGANPLPQILTVASNNSATTLRFTPTASTGTGGSWLTVSPSNLGCCYTPFPVTVTVNGSTLKAGTYTGEIIINQYANPSLAMTVPVTLTVVSPSAAFFDNLPGQTSFSLLATGKNPATQTLQLANGGGGTLSWKIASNAADGGKWLKVTPATGTNDASYTVSVTAKNLPGKGLLAGTFMGQQVLSTKTGNVTIPVVVTVGDPVFVQLPPVTFSTKVGVNPSPQVVAINSTSTAIRFTPIASSGKGGKWLSVSPSNQGCCYTPTNVTVSVNASGLAAGSYTGEVNVIEYANPAKSMTLPVFLTVTP